MNIDTGKVLGICIGVGLAVLFFIPIAIAFRLLVEGVVKRNYPELLKRKIPEVIWILSLGIIGGILFHALLLPLASGDDAIDLSGSGASAIAELGIVLVVMIAGASQRSRDLRKFAHNVRVLLLPATMGAFGVLLGSTVVAVTVRLILLNSPTDINIDIWERVWRGAVANASGWIGDSTTFYPTLSILDDGPYKFSMIAPPAIILDTICGLLWFALATHIASDHQSRDVKSDQVISQPTPGTQGESRKSAAAMAVFCLMGCAAAVAIRTMAESYGLRGWRWRPFIAIGIYLIAFIAGYVLARWDSRLASLDRKTILLFAIGFIGMKSGLSLGLNSARTIPPAFMYLSIIALGAFAGHILMLKLFKITRPRGDAPWGLLFVASMCTIGGLATAPEVARHYSDDLVEPSYAVALLCNLISLSSLLMIGVLSPT